MAKQLLRIKLPLHIYQELQDMASPHGQTAEQMVEEMLTTSMTLKPSLMVGYDTSNMTPEQRERFDRLCRTYNDDMARQKN